jgi:hypothetical protein
MNKTIRLKKEGFGVEGRKAAGRSIYSIFRAKGKAHAAANPGLPKERRQVHA